MTEVQKFLERYADTPVGEINSARAREVLQRSGFLTKAGTVRQKYADMVVTTQKTTTSKDDIHEKN